MIEALGKKRVAKRCDWCGKYIGQVPPMWAHEPESCGARECDREIANMEAADRWHRQKEAEEDDYMRYDGGY